MTTLFAGAARGQSPPPPPRLPSGSRQQEDIWAVLLGSDSHVVVEARAGCGKSSTCREGMHRLIEADPGLSCRVSYVAFNRSIADEFQAGLPAGARATTMHSAGFAALRRAFPSLGDPNKAKLRGIADRLYPVRSFNQRKFKTAAIRVAEACKAALIGCDPASRRYGLPVGQVARIAADRGIDLRGMDLGSLASLVGDLLQRAVEETASVDFSDMTWLPVMLGLEFPESAVLFVDEAQDLDPCQHALVSLMVGDGRMVVVGDPRQAIYSFRGADSRSMATLGLALSRTTRGVERLPLTATRRCPSSHVEMARNVVPDFESLPGAARGRWEKDLDVADVVEPGWMILCRKNAPLVSAAFRSVARGIPVAILGRQIGEDLARFVDDMEASTISALALQVASYRDSELARLSDLDDVDEEIEAVNDRCDCIAAASRGASTPADVSSRIRTMFRDFDKVGQSRVALFSSVHRAKGREAESVAILEPEGMPSPFARSPEDLEQELNLVYVAATRSKHRLTFLGPIPGPLKVKS